MQILGIFVKHPVPGQVKKRLASQLGRDHAAGLYAAFVTDLLDRFRDMADDRVIGFAPDETPARQYFSTLGANDYRLWPQPSLILGERLQRFFEDSFESPDDRIVVIGSDSPTLPRDLVRRAFELLETDDCVLGPATDGGYYLIGQRGRGVPLFDAIDWSGPRVLQQTVSRLAGTKATLALLPPWYDIDTIEDVELLRGHLKALDYANVAISAPATIAALGL